MLGWFNRAHGLCAIAAYATLMRRGRRRNAAKPMTLNAHLLPLVLQVAAGKRESIKIFEFRLSDSGWHLCAGTIST